MNEYIKNRIKTGVDFRLIQNTRRTLHHALNGKSKSSSRKDILAIGIDTYRKWFEYQMTPNMTWDNIEIDRVKAICFFDVSEDKELNEAFSWRITQPLLKHDHQKKVIQVNYLIYQLKIIKAYHILGLNDQERRN